MTVSEAVPNEIQTLQGAVSPHSSRGSEADNGCIARSVVEKETSEPSDARLCYPVLRNGLHLPYLMLFAVSIPIAHVREFAGLTLREKQICHAVHRVIVPVAYIIEARIRR